MRIAGRWYDIMLDYDAEGNVIGIEVLDVRERVAEQRSKAA
jgi:YD repeat-containing protein